MWPFLLWIYDFARHIVASVAHQKKILDGGINEPWVIEKEKVKIIIIGIP